MKKKLAKILSAGIVAVMLATSLAACGGSAASEEAAPAAEAEEESTEESGEAAPAAEEAPAEEAAEETAEAEESEEDSYVQPVADASAYEGLKCAFVCSDTGTVNGQKWVAGCQEAAEDLGLECQIFDCKNDITNQIQYLNEVMTQEFDVCMIHPIDASALTDIVTEMEEAGINCGTINIRVDGVYTAHVGMPNYERGIPLARKIAEDMGGKARVVAIWGPVEVMQTMQYPDAVRDIWHDEYNDEMQIIDEANGDWSVESGDQLARDFLTKYGADGFDVMLCGNDSMALGAAQALAASNVEGIYITGGDGTNDALQAVKDGRMSLTQLQMSKEWAKEGMTVLLNEHIQGQTGIERGERLEYLHTAKIVTAENVDEYLQ